MSDNRHFPFIGIGFMYTFIRLILGFVIAFTIGAGVASAVPLMVDVDSTQGGTSIETQMGWESLAISDSGDGSDTYVTSFGNVIITVDGQGARNRGDIGGDPLSDVNEDFSFQEPNGPLTVTLEGMGAGEYAVTTFHFDSCCNAQSNLFDINVTDATGTFPAIDDADWSLVGEMFNVVSDGTNPITLAIQEDSATNRMRFNGIIIDQILAVPEPTSIAIWSLIGMGLAGFGYYRLPRKK